MLKNIFKSKPQDEYQDLTQHEIQALKYQYNLADAHTHQSQSPSQRKIVARLPKLWYEAENTTQYEMEQGFIETFFRTQNQDYALKPNNGLLVYAASIAMVIMANYLMKKKMTVALMHPCFDNLHDILRNMQITPKPLQEEWFYDPDKIYENLKNNVKEDVIFLVDPNNPTGFTLFAHGKKAYQEIIRWAKDYKKILFIDYCFASFMLPDKNLDVFDVYEMFEKSGVSYITVEDTGKTWPVQDAKAAIIKTSKDLYQDIYNIHTSYLLNVSPFILNLLTEYMLNSEKDGFKSVYSLLETNRELTKKALSGSLLELQQPSAQVSVAWCKITDPAIKATALQEVILKAGVYVLPGTYFFWHDRKQGEHFIRIALARNTDMFGEAIKIVRKAVDKYQKSA
jgi:aspartate/methionine/tyrosine aminotransferase